MIGLLHGLKLVAVAIVAQAVWGMARTLCPDRERASIAVVAALIILFSAVLGRPDRGYRAGCASPGYGSAGRRRRHRPDISQCRSRAPSGSSALAAFFLLLVGLPVLRGLGIRRA